MMFFHQQGTMADGPRKLLEYASISLKGHTNYHSQEMHQSKHSGSTQWTFLSKFNTQLCYKFGIGIVFHWQ